MPHIKVAMHEEMRRKLKAAAAASGLDMGAFVRIAVADYIKSEAVPKAKNTTPVAHSAHSPKQKRGGK